MVFIDLDFQIVEDRRKSKKNRKSEKNISIKLQFKVMKDVAAAAVVPLMRIGDQLGIFEKLAGAGEVSSGEFSKLAEVDERYLREWLYALSAAGFVS